MKKKQSGWIAAGLFTIATTIATIYSLLEYRESVLIVGIASLLLLLSAFWLFTCISRLIKKEPVQSVGQEQRERMNYEGMKLQGEELIRLVNAFGKGTYAYSKRSAENLQSILEYSIQTQHINEQLMNDLIQNQTKTAKFQVKYGQEDTADLIRAFSEECRYLNDNLVKCLTEIKEQNMEIPVAQPDGNVSNSLNDLSLELAHINTSIQALQLQLASSFQPSAMYAQVQPAPAPLAADTSVPMAAVPEAVSQPTELPTADAAPAEDFSVPEEPAIPEEPAMLDESAVLEELINSEEPASLEETPVAEEIPDLEELLAEISGDTEELPSSEEPSPVEEAPEEEESSTADELANIIEFAAKGQSDSPVETMAAEEPKAAPAPEPVIPILSDDPNKKLSPDEIAALFASLG